MIDPKVFELSYDNLGTDLSVKEVTYLLFKYSKRFKQLFYFLATINELQVRKFIGQYVEIPEGLQQPYKDLNSTGYSLSESEVDNLLSRISWDSESKLYAKKFFLAYANTDYFNKRKVK